MPKPNDMPEQKDLEKVQAIFDINSKPPWLWTDEEVSWAKNQMKAREEGTNG